LSLTLLIKSTIETGGEGKDLYPLCMRGGKRGGGQTRGTKRSNFNLNTLEKRVTRKGLFLTQNEVGGKIQVPIRRWAWGSQKKKQKRGARV